MTRPEERCGGGKDPTHQRLKLWNGISHYCGARVDFWADLVKP
jgi:hypothetical protein